MKNEGLPLPAGTGKSITVKPEPITPHAAPSLNLQGWFADDLLTLHAGCDREGHRPVLKIDNAGICIQLESWDNGELVSVDQLGSYARESFDRAMADFCAEVAIRGIA